MDTETPAPVFVPVYLGCYQDNKSANPAPNPDPERIFSVWAGTFFDSMDAEVSRGIDVFWMTPETMVLRWGCGFRGLKTLAAQLSQRRRGLF